MKKFTKTTDDSELILALKNGDNTAFECIIEKYTKPLSITVFQTIKDLTLTEDIVQESFLKLLIAIQDGTYSHSNQTIHWLKRVGSNLCIDYFRKKQKYPTSSLSTQLDNSGGSFADILEDLTTSHEELVSEDSHDFDFNIDPRINLQDMVNQLPDEQKEVVLLRFYRNFSFLEISEYTESPMSTCLGRMRYALINLRKILSEKK